MGAEMDQGNAAVLEEAPRPPMPARPLRILELRDTHEIGGPGKTILETYRAIDRTRFSMHLGVFLTRKESGDTPFVRAARDCGLPVHLIQGRHQFDPSMIWRVAELVRRLDIDVVHAHEVKSDVIAYLASWIRRVPIVTTAHGWIGNTARQKAFIALDRHVVGRYHAVLVVSSRMREEVLAAGVPERRVRLLRNGIVLENYRREAWRGSLQALLGRSLEGPVIVSVGRLSPEKGHADLIEALAIVRGRGATVSAVLAGDGPSRRALEEQIAALGLTGHVAMPGYIREPQRVLADADLMVLPSHTEGLPNAALEALAMEVPVLATRVGGTPEVIVDGATGFLVPPRAPRAIAEGIDRFLADRAGWNRTAMAGRLRVGEHFDFGVRTRALERIYLDVAEGAKS